VEEVELEPAQRGAGGRDETEAAREVVADEVAVLAEAADAGAEAVAEAARRAVRGGVVEGLRGGPGVGRGALVEGEQGEAGERAEGDRGGDAEARGDGDRRGIRAVREERE